MVWNLWNCFLILIYHTSPTRFRDCREEITVNNDLGGDKEQFYIVDVAVQCDMLCAEWLTHTIELLISFCCWIFIIKWMHEFSRFSKGNLKYRSDIKLVFSCCTRLGFFWCPFKYWKNCYISTEVWWVSLGFPNCAWEISKYKNLRYIWITYTCFHIKLSKLVIKSSKTCNINMDKWECFHSLFLTNWIFKT